MVLDGSQKKKPVKREKRQKGGPLDNFHPSTKIKALLGDLIQFSRMNEYSVNYDPEIQVITDNGMSDNGVVKTVVL